jgi:aminomethyltransferase
LQNGLAALTRGCGLYDAIERAFLKLTGSDRVRWLNGMVTNNVRDLAPNHGVYAFVLNPQGHILGDVHVFNRGDFILVTTGQAQTTKLVATFEHYIIMDDVEVTDISKELSALVLMGSMSKEVLRQAGIDASELRALEIRDLSWRGDSIVLVRGDEAISTGFEIWGAPAILTPLREELVRAGATPVSRESIEAYRIAQGIPRYGLDIRERDLPQETSQSQALNFSKGCYIGQEIVERIRSRGNVHRQFTGFDVEGSLPASGTKIQAEGKDVGEITSTAALPLIGRERRVALGYIRRELAVPGKVLQAGDTTLVVAALPFTGIL